MKWLRPGPSPHQTALAMIGAKAGQQVLFIGAGDGRLPAEVARVTGLNGRTLVIDSETAAQDVVETAAADAGTLVEFQRSALSMVPADPGTFDIAVIHQSLGAAHAHRDRIVADAARVLRDGGRVVVIEGVSVSGILGKLRRPAASAMPSGEIQQLLTTAGLRAARTLAETDGVTYVEASKPRLNT
jgi:ubiquinone/menaquinone biosynthesis C-methylase UbiE